MIKIDYRLVRNEGDEVVTYVPDKIPNELNNVVYLQGPNGSGKSTILNLIALAFFGNKIPEKEIDPSIKNKIKNLLDINHQKIQFNICIDNPEMGIRLIAEKPSLENLDFTVKKITNGNEVILNSDSFLREFKLVYDIPHDPLVRLPQLLQEVQLIQNDTGVRIGDLREYLRLLIDDIKNSRDPEILEDFKKKRLRLQKETNDLEVEKKRLYTLAKKIVGFGFSKMYVNYARALDNENNKLEDIKKQIEKENRKQKKDAKEDEELIKRVNDNFSVCNSHYFRAAQLLSHVSTNKDKDFYSLWRQSALQDEVYHPDVHTTLRSATTYFINTINETLQYENINSKNEIEAVELYKLLIKTLSNTKYNEITIPGINQTVGEFLALLSSELRTHEGLLDKLNNLIECKKVLNDLIQSIEKTIIAIQNIQAKNSQAEINDFVDIQGLMNEKKSIETQINYYIKKVDGYREQLINQHLDPARAFEIYKNFLNDDEISPYESLSEDDLIRRLNEVNYVIEQKEDQIKKLRKAIDIKNNEIAIMEIKTPHEYKKYQNLLEVYYQKIQRMEQRFRKQYSGYIEHIIEHNRLQYGTEESHYIDQLGIYLAAKIHILRHVDKEYIIKNIRILEEKIITDIDKEIYFTDLGTGQGQAAFLTAKLAMNDKKKVIALFDEVAMIDENNLKPVKEKLIQLYKEKKLFMAIIVQKNDIVKVESLL